MTKHKTFTDLLTILSEQMDSVSKKDVSREERKNALAVSSLVANYVSLSVHKFEYDINKKEGMPRIPAFEDGDAES